MVLQGFISIVSLSPLLSNLHRRILRSAIIACALQKNALRFTTCFRSTCTQWSLSWMRISCPRRQMWKHILKRFENDEKKRKHIYIYIYIFCIILRIVSAWRDFEIRGRTRSAQNRRPTFHNFRANGSKTANAKGQAMTLTSEASRPQSQD